MKALNEKFQKLDALTVRERLIIFVLILAGIWTAIDFLLLKPLDKASKEAQQKLSAARSTLNTAEKTLSLLASRPDPNREARQRLEKAQRALSERLQNAERLQARMVQPKDRSAVLQSMLTNQPGLRLAKLETLPPEPVGAAVITQAQAVVKAVVPQAPTESTSIYKHGVKITLVGSYAALTQYMEKLETMPVGFYWARAELDARAHPNISLTLTLYTLSLEKTWLTV